MSDDLFRAKAIEKMASPEKLDRLVTIVSPKSWILLTALGGMILVITIWGFFGSIPSKVEGAGIIISGNGFTQVYADKTGIVYDISVRAGDFISLGDVVARTNVNSQVIDMNRLIEDIEAVENYNLDQGDSATKNVRTQSLIEIENSIKSAREQLNNLTYLGSDESQVKERQYSLDEAEKLLNTNKVMYEQGVISKADYDNIVTNYDKAKMKLNEILESNNSEVKEMNKQIQSLTEEFETTKKIALADMNKDLENLMYSINNNKIISNQTGIVYQILVDPGESVQAGTSVLKIESQIGNEKSYEAVLYLPIQTGKKLTPGMNVKIYPSTANKQEHGHMEAVVTQVSDYVVSTDDIASRLGSTELISIFTAQSSALVEVRTKFVTDDESVSGYKWSTKRGSEIDINNGTICSAGITVSSQKPITMVIPFLKEKLLYGNGEDN
jgi:HlyD family secretion protein